MEFEAHKKYMQAAINLALEGMQRNDGGPFGAVIVRNNIIVGQGNNRVTSTNDPTAHAEVVAIRDACQRLGTFQLDDCTIYTSCEPCPMCLGAVYWARAKALYYGCGQADAAAIGFDDQFIYEEIATTYGQRKIPFQQILRDEALKPFRLWDEKSDKSEY